MFKVIVSQQGGEYQGTVLIEGREIEQLDFNSILVDNKLITFQYEHIQEIIVPE